MVEASCGSNHTCLLLDDGKVRMFGRNDNGECTMPELGGRRVVQAECGGKHTALLLDDASVVIVG